MATSLKFVVKHSRKVGEKYISTRVGSIIEKDGRLIMKLDYQPPTGDWLAIWPYDPDFKKDS